MADAERISVSVEVLRAELAQLELRLIDRLVAALAQKADLSHIEQLEKRVQSLEISRASREGQAQTITDYGVELERLKRFRYAFPSVAVLALGLSALTLYFALLYP